MRLVIVMSAICANGGHSPFLSFRLFSSPRSLFVRLSSQLLFSLNEGCLFVRLSLSLLSAQGDRKSGHNSNDDFHSSQALTTPDLSSNQFDNEGGRSLAQALKINQVFKDRETSS